MPERKYTGPDGREWVELPGGVTFPTDELKEAPASSGVMHYLLDPELVAGAASFVPGVGTLAAGGIGAGMSVARDLAEGQTDPWAIAGRAAMHGGVNMIPGGVGAIVSKGMRAVPLAETGANILTHGAARGSIISLLRSVLGKGATEAAEAATGPTAEMLSMTLGSGKKVFSSEGMKELVQRSIDLENQGAPRATVQALDKLIQQVRDHLANPSIAQTINRAGMQATTAAERAAAAAATRGGRVSNLLRLMLAGSSEYGGY